MSQLCHGFMTHPTLSLQVGLMDMATVAYNKATDNPPHPRIKQLGLMDMSITNRLNN